MPKIISAKPSEFNIARGATDPAVTGSGNSNFEFRNTKRSNSEKFLSRFGKDARLFFCREIQ
jgi:hypothetical protein